MRVVEVRPEGAGWTLHTQGVHATWFRSGAAAEQAGRNLARRLASPGMPAKLVIRLRDGSFGGRVLFPPEQAWRPEEQAA